MNTMHLETEEEITLEELNDAVYALLTGTGQQKSRDEAASEYWLELLKAPNHQ